MPALSGLCDHAAGSRGRGTISGLLQWWFYLSLALRVGSTHLDDLLVVITLLLREELSNPRLLVLC